MGSARVNKTYHFPPSNIIVPTDTASIEYGKHRAETLCQGCHGEDLSGVNNWFNAAPLGTIDSANLTSGEGGVGREFTSDEDLGAIIAYVKSVPPVDHKTNGQHFTPLAKIMLAGGMLGKLPVEAVSHEIHVTAPERGVSVEYGEYMININDCHV